MSSELGTLCCDWTRLADSNRDFDFCSLGVCDAPVTFLVLFELNSSWSFLSSTSNLVFNFYELYQMIRNWDTLLSFDRGYDPSEFILNVIHYVTGISGVRSLALLVILGEDLELIGAELEHFSNVEHALCVLLLSLFLFLKLFFQHFLLFLED